MDYYDYDLNSAWGWFASNWDKWANLNTPITIGIINVMNNTSGPYGAHKEPYYEWVRDNRAALLELYNELK